MLFIFNKDGNHIAKYKTGKDIKSKYDITTGENNIVMLIFIDDKMSAKEGTLKAHLTKLMPDDLAFEFFENGYRGFKLKRIK